MATPISEDLMTLLRHKNARRRAAEYKAAHPAKSGHNRPTQNPYIGSHPDLFGASKMDQYPRRPGPVREGKDGSDLEHEIVGPLPGTAAARAKHAAGPDSPTFVPLSDLTSEQIRELKRAQFTDEEWDEIDEDDREYIEENDVESQARVDLLADVFIKRWEWDAKPKSDERSLYSRVESIFEGVMADEARSDTLFHWLPDASFKTLVRYAEVRDQDESDVERYLNEILANTNLYDFTTDRYQRSRGVPSVFEHEIEGNVYVERGDWEEYMAMCTPDEVVRAIEKIEDDTGHDIDLKVDDLIKRQYVEKTFNTGVTVYALLHVDNAMDVCIATIEENISDHEADDADDPPDALPAQERVVYRWTDGFYVLDLLPSDLAAEGQAMGMCVGRPDMGYGRAVRDGEIKILSVRRPSGKPLFTIEAQLNAATQRWQPGRPAKIIQLDQFKGKANRLPGFDLGKTAPGTPLKKDEVVRIYEFVEGPGGLGEHGLGQAVDDVADLKPAAREVNRLYREGDKWAIDLLTRLGIEKSQVDSWRAGAHGDPRENPSPACGRHGEGCTGFCAPYQRKR